MLLALLCIAVPLYVSLYMIVAAQSRIYYSVAAVPSASVALVLGASVSSRGVLSPVMQERADKAIQLYLAHKVEKVLVTGDNSTLAYNEVYPVGKYLLAAGIPQKDIFLDYAGFDTYSSMFRARDVFGAESVIVVSQRFHLPRALFIARHLGLRAYGIDAAPPGQYYYLSGLREWPASVKALWEVSLKRVPKFLGGPFPLSGAGTPTWVGGEIEMVYFKHDR